MAVPVTAIQQRLLADPAIAAIVLDRVYPFDPMRHLQPGMVMGAGGDVDPALSIDDQGSMAAISGPPGSHQSYVAIWAYAPLTDTGRTAVRSLMQLVIASLHQWQDPDSRAMLMFGNELGDQPANLADTVTNYARFSVNGVLAGVSN